MQTCVACRRLLGRRRPLPHLSLDKLSATCLMIPINTNRWQQLHHTAPVCGLGSFSHVINRSVDYSYLLNRSILTTFWGHKVMLGLSNTHGLIVSRLFSSVTFPSWGVNVRNYSVDPLETEGKQMSASDDSQALTVLVQKLMSALPDKNEELIRSFVEPLLSMNCKPRDVILMFCKRPELMNIAMERWQAGLTSLSDNGFSGHYLLSVVTGYPKVFSPGGIMNVTETMEVLRENGIHQKAAHRLVANNPEIFFLRPREVTSKIVHLKTLFTSYDVIKLTLNSPNILSDPFEETKAKMLYVSLVMGVPEKEIMKSRVFQFPLQHTRCRHLFLERAGLYKTPDKHGATMIANLSLREIVDTPNNVFAIEKVGMETKDYETFTRMMENEELDMELFEVYNAVEGYNLNKL